jgi:hypothetical protein
VRDAVLAAEEHRAHVHVLDPLPRLQRGVEHGLVVAGVDARVVEEHVDAAELLPRRLVHRLDLPLVGHVGDDRQVPDRVLDQVHAHDRGALLAEQPRGLRADAARGARDHADLAVQPSHQSSSVETKTFFTSV